MAKATNVTTSAKRASKAVVAPSQSAMIGFCVAAFREVLDAEGTLQNAKAMWDAARKGLRVELARAYGIIGTGKAWDAFKAELRAALVAAKVTVTPEDAGRIINNALIALKLTGQGAKKGGKKSGRPEVTSTGEATDVTTEAPNNAALALAYIAEQQARHAGDDEMLEVLGTIAKILAGQQ